MSDGNVDDLIPNRKFNRGKNSADLNNGDSTKLLYGEKVELFNALVKHGSSNIKLLAQNIPNRSEEYINNYLINTKKSSRQNLKDCTRKAPIDKWLDYIIKADSTSKENLTDISCALKYIALFEPRFENANIDLRDCYLVLSDCLRGEAPKHMNSNNSLFLFENFQKMARTMKDENKESQEAFLENVKKYKSKSVKCYSGRRKVKVSVAASKVSGIINPLNVPDSLLVIKK